jgi:hypothetical protein
MGIRMEFPQKLKVEPPYDPVIPLLGIYPKESKSAYCRVIRMSMFTAALFTTAKLLNQPRCPTVNEWIKKMWYIYTVEFLLSH